MRVVAALGVFDGVHRGHQRILRTAVRRARALDGTAVAVTFHPHPQKVLHPRQAPPSLISLEHRLLLMQRLGIAVVLIVPFSRRFARLSPEAFCARVLQRRLQAREVVVGHNFAFGQDRRGTTTFLRHWGRRHGVRVHVIPPVVVRRQPVSSSRIRRAIERGRLAQAAALLGRSVSLRGRVVRGASRGAALGFPTANLALDHEAMPPRGVYAVTVRLLGRRGAGPTTWFSSPKAKLGLTAESRILRRTRWWGGVLNLGVRPTFERRTTPVAEVHIFRFHRSIYDQWVEVQFCHKLRNERTFPSREALTRQIRRDVTRARRLLRLK